jgi:CubicO group peptidase (beta-lactamase class C family)
MSIAQKMQEGVDAGVFPGGVLLVSYKGAVCVHKAFGFAQIIPTKIPLTVHTLFDVASLTKPFATATGIALLAQSQRLRLEDPVAKFIPAYQSGEKRKITLAHLLSHSAGLPDWKPYFWAIIREDKKTPGFLGSPSAKQKVYQMARNEPLINPPGTHSLYSDIGFMLLGEIIEKVSGESLNVFCENNIFSKLNCKKTFFPAIGRKITGRISATEDCPWREKVLRGEVHDDNTYAMGGVSGHAGLFSTAQEVFILVTAWLNAINGEGFIEANLAKRFVTRRRTPKGSSFAFGWDTPSMQNSSSGHFFSPQSFGHLGYTGTSIWVDRVKDLVVILLTNRVHPTRKNNQIKEFRPALHDIVYDCCSKFRACEM